MNKEIKSWKLKIPSMVDRISSVDPAGLAPAPLLTKGSILLHEIQARVHRRIVKQKKPFCKDIFCGKQFARSSYEHCLMPL